MTESDAQGIVVLIEFLAGVGILILIIAVIVRFFEAVA